MRQMMIEKLQQLPQEIRQFETQAIFQQLKTLIVENNYKNIACYYGEFPEVEIGEYLTEVESLGCRLFLPRTEKNKQMTFREFHSTQLERSSFGVIQPKNDAIIIEPNELDLLIIPGLLFSPKGFRIGFGGGYYDRFLEKNRAMPTCSLVFRCQFISDLDRFKEPHDELIDVLVMADGIHPTRGEVSHG